MGPVGVPDLLEPTAKPVAVQSLSDKQVVRVRAGGLSSAAITQNGELYTWGVNDQGALGRDTEDDTITGTASETLEAQPGRVDFPPGIEGIMTCAVGDTTMACISSEGIPLLHGQFRDNNGPRGKICLRPTVLETDPPGVQFVQVERGCQHYVFLSTEGHVYTIGSNAQGALGRPTIATTSLQNGNDHELVRVLDGLNQDPNDRVLAVGAADYASFAMMASGQVRAWGHNNYGQLGQISSSTAVGTSDWQSEEDGNDSDEGEKKKRNNESEIVDTTAHCEHDDDNINGHYILAHPGQAFAIRDFPVPQNHIIEEICGGLDFTLFRTNRGSVFALGLSQNGVLGGALRKGIEFGAVSKVATLVPGIRNCTNISAYNFQSAAVMGRSKIVAWGSGQTMACGNDDNDGQDVVEPRLFGLPLNDDRRQVFDVSMGGVHSLFLLGESS